MLSFNKLIMWKPTQAADEKRNTWQGNWQRNICPGLLSAPLSGSPLQAPTSLCFLLLFRFSLLSRMHSLSPSSPQSCSASRVIFTAAPAERETQREREGERERERLRQREGERERLRQKEGKREREFWDKSAGVERSLASPRQGEGQQAC